MSWVDSWPKHTFSGLTIALAGIALMFSEKALADAAGLALILFGGGVMVYVCWRRDPIGKKGKRERARQLMVASGLLAAMIVFASYQTRAHYLSGQPPQVKLRITRREVHEMGIGIPVKVNIGFTNAGTATALVNRATRLAFVPGERVDKIFGELRRELASGKDPGVSVPPESPAWFTIVGPELQAGDFVPPGSPAPHVYRNGLALLVAGIIRASGAGDVEFCFYAMNPNVMIVCNRHNT